MNTIQRLFQLFQAISVAAILMFAAVPVAAQTIAKNFYVNPEKGNDNNPGTSVSAPFKTLSKVKGVVRGIDKTKSGDIIVNLLGGTYYPPSTLAFDEKDGGSATCKVIYTNYKDEVPVISGGKEITGWKLFDKAKNIYRAPANSMEFRQLYVNGKRTIRARQPNIGSNYQIVDYKKPLTTIKINKSELLNIKSIEKTEIVTTNNFTSNHLRIKSFTSDNNYSYIDIQDNEKYILNHITEGAFWKKNYFFENAYEFIDAEGEWYLNTADGFVYYKPFKDENIENAEVIAPNLETIVKVEGASLDSPVLNLEFRGIEFMYATWLWPNKNGCVEYQAFHPLSNVQTEIEGQYKEYGAENNFGAPGGVYVAKADYITFERCGFQHMGANGLKLHYGTHNCKIIGNVVNDISGNGIYEMMQNYDNKPSMEKYNPADIREVSSYDLICNNFVNNSGVDYKGSVGIFCGYARNVTIAHNEVVNMPYTGISVGWGWGGLKDTTVMADNKIVDNFVHNVNMDTIMWDGGGIYTLADQPHSICNNNYVISRCRGLYFDEGTGNYTITNNVVDSGHEWITFWSKKHHDNIADNNYTVNLKNRDIGTNCVIRNTIHVPDRNWPKQAKDIISKAGLEEKYKDIKDEKKWKSNKLGLDPKGGK